MSFFEELKRRNVFKVGIAYAIAAWLLLQIVDLVLDNIAAPGWVVQVFMLALAVGFPIAIIIAWAFEVTTEGVKLEKNVDRSHSIARETGKQLNRGIIMILAVAVVFLLTERFRDEKAEQQGSGSISSPSTQTGDATPKEKMNLTPPEESTPSEKSIAVLPFVDMSEKGDQAYFADGISEEILNVLVKTHSLKVAGRTSSFQFRGENEDLRNIGEQLGVDNILEGSIRKANNRVRITAQLVKAGDGFHLWSETYDRDLTDIFAIQDEIARAITDALAIELNLGATSKPLVTAGTSNMEAYDRYLEGKGLITQRQDFVRATQLLDEVNQMDPAFAAGWAANAQAHSLSYYYLDINREDAMQQAESMAKKALAIEPDLSMAHSVLGDVYRDRSRWQEARTSYLRALALNPDDVEANEQYAQMLWRAYYFAEAMQYSATAVRLDPLSWLNLTVNASLHYVSGDRSGAQAEMERVMMMGGRQQEFALRHAIRMALGDNKLEKAIALMTDLPASHGFKDADGKLKARYGALIPLLNSRQATLAFLAANHGMPSSRLWDNWEMYVSWAAYYGDFALAEKIMERGLHQDEANDVLASGWLHYPLLRPLHNSAQFKRMVRTTGLEKFWRENGFPKNCRPLGEDDFACN